MKITNINKDNISFTGSPWNKNNISFKGHTPLNHIPTGFELGPRKIPTDGGILVHANSTGSIIDVFM